MKTSDKENRAPHIYIVGQTASGKTGFSLDVCEDLGLEVLNTDSLLFYKNLDIGTAKPSPEEQSRVPHHLIDICEAGEELIASSFLKKAERVLSHPEKKFLCVGGSGFYVNALDVGLLPLPETDVEIKKQVLEIENPVTELESVDPEIFNKISKNDLYRVCRALEVFKQTGKPLSVWQKEFLPSPVAKKIAFEWDRAALKKRIELRVKLMLENGFVEEVESLLERGFSSWKPMHSVGYSQVIQFLNGQYKAKSEMIDDIVTKTMQLSKRQKTWFKKDQSVIWFDYDETCDNKKAKDFVKDCFRENSWRV